MATARKPAPQERAPVPKPRPRPARPHRTPVPIAPAQQPSVRLNPARENQPRSGLPPQVARLIGSSGAGDPLPPRVQRILERTFDVDLSLVRVHTNPQAADSIGARAFAYGLHIYLGSGESPADLALMAHEVAHVVQQQGAAVFQMYSAAGTDRFEHEAEQASASAQRGGRAVVQERTGSPKIQRQGLLDRGAAWLRDQVMGLLEEHAPELVPILRQGVIEWLKERLGAAVRAMMDSLAGPVRSIGDLVTAVRKHFTNLVGWLREAGGKIARGDCSSISEAADKIHQVFDALAAPVVDRVKHYANTVKQFFQGLWDRFGAPVWALLQRIGGAIWEQIQRIGRWIWEKTQPIRDWLSRAWTWFKNWLGIGEGEEGQNGVLQWFQRKAGEAWEWVSARLAPYKRQILIVVGILALLSPAGPIIAITAVAAGILRGIQWLRQNMRRRGSVVQGQGILRGVILPAILGAIDRVSGVVTSIAASITGALGRVVASLSEMVATVSATPILNFATGLVTFLADGFRGLLGWAIEGVQGLAGLLQSGLQRLGGFARMLVDFLGRVAAAAANVMRIGYAIGGRVWNLIPACIRDPFIDFFIPLILRQISFFRELASSPEAWQQTRGQIMELIRQVFRDFDLIGAMKGVFRLVVRALRIPVDLALKVLEKGAEAFDLVIGAPLRFIENSLKAILRGIGFFMRNFLGHLWFGVQGWLLNAIEQSGTGVRPPASWDLRGLFGFVLDVLGISLDHVLDLLATRVGRPVVQRIRQAINILTGVWEWVKIAIEEGPAGLWRKVTESLSNLGRMVLEAAVGWVMTRIIAIVSARLTALAASAGFSGILEAVVAVYQAITTAIEYARRILEVMLTVFTTIVQIARGVIDPAAQGVERGLRLIMPVVIGFLANYAGLGGLGGRIREIILDIRARVDRAILGLIDRALAAGRWLLDRLRAGVAAVVEWWRSRFQFTAASGRRHTLYLSGPSATDKVMIASNGTDLIPVINDRLKPESDATPDQRRALGRALAKIRSINDIKATMASSSNKTDPNTLATRINRLFEQLAADLIAGGVDPTPLLPQTSILDFKKDAMGRGIKATADPLTQRGRPGSPTVENVFPPAWIHVTPDYRGEYVKMHLISARYHGPGNDNANLVAAPQTVNTGWVLRQVEEPIYQALYINDRTLKLTVDVKYEHSDPAKPWVNLFPSWVKFAWEALDNRNLPNSTKKTAEKSDTISPPRFVQTTPELNRDPSDRLINLVGFNNILATAIINMRTRDGSFSSTTDLVNRLQAHIARNPSIFYPDAYTRSFQAQLRLKKDKYVLNNNPIEEDKL